MAYTDKEGSSSTTSTTRKLVNVLDLVVNKCSSGSVISAEGVSELLMLHSLRLFLAYDSQPVAQVIVEEPSVILFSRSS